MSENIAEAPVQDWSMVPAPTIEVIDVVIDQSKTMAQLIAACNSSSQVDERIVEANFPMGLIPEGKELVCVCFHTVLDTGLEVKSVRAECGLEPVTSPAYILTVRATKPELMRVIDGTLFDIDSVWRPRFGHRHCLCLQDDLELKLTMVDGDDGFEDGPVFQDISWFLALRDKPKS